MYTDPSGYAAGTNLTETTVAAAIAVMLASAVAFHDQAMMNIFTNLRRNLASGAILPQCTVTVADWKNVILGFPAHDFDTKWIVTIPAALLSWRLFEAIYATDNDTSNIPGVPVYEDEKEIINGIPAEEQSGSKIIQDKVIGIGDITEDSKEKWGKGTFDSVEESLKRHFRKHGAEVGARDINDYVNKAYEFSKNLKRAKRAYPDDGTSGAIRYTKNGKYIIIGPDGKILSYGLAR